MEAPILQAIKPPAITPKTERARAAAEQFESLFVSLMMKEMRKTVGENEMMPTSLGENIYTEMLDGKFADMVSKQGNLGLAELILKQIPADEGGEAGRMLDRLKNSQWMSDPRFAAQTTSAPQIGTSLAQRMDTLRPIIEQAARTYAIDPDLIAAVIAQESGGNPYAVSAKGAKGLMQLIDSTAHEMGVQRVFDPRDNIMAGTKYLRSMLDRYNGDNRLALAAYNAGPSAVDRHGDVPPYNETRNYIERVLDLKGRFEKIRTDANAIVVEGSDR